MNLQLKLASPADMLTTFEWANESMTRKFSYSSNRILFEDHSKWYTGKMLDDNCIYLILWAEYQPCGQIRYDISGNVFLISFNIDVNFRGKGLGTKILKLGQEYLEQYVTVRPITLIGFVKKENIASIISFERNNYVKEEANTASFPNSFAFSKQVR